MNMVINILCSLLSIAFVVLVNLSNARKDFKVSNESFQYKKYFKMEFTYIATSVIVIILAAFCRKELFALKPSLEVFERTFFALLGGAGSYAFELVLGKTKRHIRTVIDDKTNELDALRHLSDT